MNIWLLSTYWVKKHGANQAVCVSCLHAQWCVFKREVMSVYIVMTINTKNTWSKSKIHKMDRNMLGFFGLFFAVVFIAVQTVSYIRKIAVMTSSPKIYCQSFRLSLSRIPWNLSTDILNLPCDLDLEHSNPFFPQDTPAYDAVLTNQVWLQTEQQFRRYNRHSHLLII